MNLMQITYSSNKIKFVRFDVFTAVIMMMMIFFWVMAPCRLVSRCQRFREIYGLHPVLSSIISSALKMETVCFSETLAPTYEPTRLQNPEKQQHQD
jgi:hypothetical protein